MKKRGISILAIASFFLVGCNRTTSSDVSANSGDATGNVVVTWWNNYQVPDTTAADYDETKSRSNSTYREYWYAKDVIAAFEEANPGIKIETTYKGSYSDIATAVKSAISAGNQPTIVSGYQDNVYTYNSMKATYDMSAVGAELEADTDFNKNYLSVEKGVYGGKYLSLPYSKSAEMLVVNQTVFDQVGEGASGTSTGSTAKKDYIAPVAVASKVKYSVPENWTELIALARQMKTDYPTLFANQKDSDGYFNAVPFVWDSAENMFISLMENSGIGYTDSSKSGSQSFKWNCQEAKDLVIQLKKWNNEGLIATQNQLYITNATKGYHQYSSSMMTFGTVFMCISSTAGSRYFGIDSGYTASMHHVPNWAENSKAANAKVISQGPSLTFFTNKDSKVNEAAGKFYKFLTNAENSAKLAVNTSYFPLRTSSYNSTSVTSLTAKADTAVTVTSSKSDKNDYYTGNALKLNSTYTSNSNYFMSDVYQYSAASRTAVGNLLNTVFNTVATTDDAITSLVDTAFTTAVSSAVK